VGPAKLEDLLVSRRQGLGRMPIRPKARASSGVPNRLMAGTITFARSSVSGSHLPLEERMPSWPRLNSMAAGTKGLALGRRRAPFFSTCR